MEDYRTFLPPDFINRMEQMLGQEAEAFFQSYFRERRHGLRLNSLHGITEVPFPLGEAVPWWDGAYYYDTTETDRVSPGKHPLHAAGAYYIQEPSAMAPVTFLDVKPGMRVLDLCAAPGGKSTQIGQLLKGEGLLVSNEIHPARAKILSENIERMGLANAVVTNADPDRLSDYFPGYFDRILVDAPCSGEGMFIKNREEATTEWSPENVDLCAERQDTILEAADRMLGYGGRLVFSTCTFSVEENEGSMARFLTGHPEYRVSDVWELIPEEWGMSHGNPSWLKETYSDEIKEQLNHTVRLWPHKMTGEGHFFAVLVKGEAKEWAPLSENLPSGKQKKKAGKHAGKQSVDPVMLFSDFSKKELKFSYDESDLNLSGDQIYLLPKGLPNLSGLRVLRPGLHLASVKKNRLEPAHALAHALNPNQVAHVIHLPSDGAEAAQYLRGETFSRDGENGWYLVCVDECPLGWGKLTNGVVKNHYPKGLRSPY